MKGEVTISLEEYERILSLEKENKEIKDKLEGKYKHCFVNECRFGSYVDVVFSNDSDYTDLLESCKEGTVDLQYTRTQLMDEMVKLTNLKERITNRIKSKKNLFGNVDGDTIIELLK